MLEHGVEHAGRHERVLEALKLQLYEAGYASYGGKVNATLLCSDFAREYSDVLDSLGYGTADKVSNHWLVHLMSAKRATYAPILYILLVRFLGKTIQDIFSGKANAPFGMGPWPCLNKVCRYYEQLVIKHCEIRRADWGRGDPSGIFTCHCGFSYARQGPDKRPADLYRIGRIVSFGHVWEREYERLARIDDMSLRERSRRLGVDTGTVKLRDTRHSQLLRSDRQDQQIDPKSRARQAWLHLLKQMPMAKIKQLRAAEPALYMRLYRNDRGWLRQNSPMKAPKPIVRQRVDWAQRDKDLVKAVKQSHAVLLRQPGSPSWITSTAIARATGMLSTIQHNKTKLNMTTKILEQLAESRVEFALRRIQWAMLVHQDEHLLPTRWKLIKMAGVERLLGVPLIQQALDNAIKKIIRDSH